MKNSIMIVIIGIIVVVAIAFMFGVTGATKGSGSGSAIRSSSGSAVSQQGGSCGASGGCGCGGGANIQDSGVINNTANQQNAETQRITLSMKNYNYYPNTIKVKAGQPVSITLDESVSGCYRSFTIRDLNVAKYSRTPSDTIDFVPAKKGTFRFSCSMGMGTGTIIVE